MRTAQIGPDLRLMYFLLPLLNCNLTLKKSLTVLFIFFAVGIDPAIGQSSSRFLLHV